VVADKVSCLRASAVLVAVEIGFDASDVLSTFANPTVVLDSQFTVAPVKSTAPVNVGDAVGAYDDKEVVKAYDDKLLAKAYDGKLLVAEYEDKLLAKA
jgi:hypothetical protein